MLHVVWATWLSNGCGGAFHWTNKCCWCLRVCRGRRLQLLSDGYRDLMVRWALCCCKLQDRLKTQPRLLFTIINSEWSHASRTVKTVMIAGLAQKKRKPQGFETVSSASFVPLTLFFCVPTVTGGLCLVQRQWTLQMCKAFLLHTWHTFYRLIKNLVLKTSFSKKNVWKKSSSNLKVSNSFFFFFLFLRHTLWQPVFFLFFNVVKDNTKYRWPRPTAATGTFASQWIRVI